MRHLHHHLQPILKQQQRHISIVTCVDRSVFPTAPWQEIQKASDALLESNDTITVTPLAYSDASNSLVLPNSPELLNTCEALVIGTRDESLLKEMLQSDVTPSLKWIHCLAAGVDQLPFAQLRARAAIDPNFLVTHHSGISSLPLAEYVLAGYLHFAKHLTIMAENKKNKIYQRPPGNISPMEISNTTVGVIGYGSIGRSVAKMCKLGFDMRVIGMTRRGGGRRGKRRESVDDDDDEDKKEDEDEDDFADIHLAHDDDNLRYLLEESDLVVLALPKTRRTSNLLGRRELSWMKSVSVLCNVGRGNSIDEISLASMLTSGPRNGELRGVCAALDVYEREPLLEDSPLWNVPADRILLSPHSADQTDRYWSETAGTWLFNASSYVENGGAFGCGLEELRERSCVVDLDEEY